jgi:hypothetical protein
VGQKRRNYMFLGLVSVRGLRPRGMKLPTIPALKIDRGSTTAQPNKAAN